MTDTAPPLVRRDPRIQVALTAALLLLLAGVSWTLWAASSSSSARFADAEILRENRLGAATLDIEAGRGSASFAVANLAPGDRASAHIEIVNVGSLPLVTTIRVNTGDGTLADWLRYSAWVVADRCRADDLESGRASALVEDANALSAAADLTAGAPLRLASGETVVLCLGAHLSLDAGNDVQGRSSAVDLVLDAVHDLDAEET